MPKKVVVEFGCDRCPKKWYADEEAPTAALALTFTKPGTEPVVLDFGVLCESCEEAVTNYVAGIAKKRKPKEPSEAQEPEPETEG